MPSNPHSPSIACRKYMPHYFAVRTQRHYDQRSDEEGKVWRSVKMGGGISGMAAGHKLVSKMVEVEWSSFTSVAVELGGCGAIALLESPACMETWSVRR